MGSIICLTYSEQIDMIAFGGVSGKIILLDQKSRQVKGTIEGHKSEIKMLKFFGTSLYSISSDGEIGIWNSNNMTEFSVHKAPMHMNIGKILSCCFFKNKIMMATTKLYEFKMHKFLNLKIEDES